MANVQGLDSLNRKLRRLPDAARAEIGKAMEAGAAEIVVMAKSLVPVESGDLRESIGWTYGDAPAGALVLATAASRSNNLRITVYAGNDRAFYARWQEFGTQNHPANPFFYVSYRALRRRVRGRVTRAITKSAKRVAAGG